ncbi:hypothetical protein A8926_0144 [Saccharopolyspora spinosa]|uniref:Uncharacterized protein n=1 Tax=Saccharopolyspora spinosa TaxID=60894 RepID=A0A2N3XPU9_SACSN|nr:hypothetical protein A8926_0144 [Saccharopolyspora spinosa]
MVPAGRPPLRLFWNALVDEANGPFVSSTVVDRPFASHRLASRDQTVPIGTATGTSRKNEFPNRLYSRGSTHGSPVAGSVVAYAFRQQVQLVRGEIAVGGAAQVPEPDLGVEGDSLLVTGQAVG